jgi:hypothetical protein
MNDIIKIQKAIKFATKTHEVYQKQKRRGKDIAYIVHPLTVGILLARVGASDDAVCAGILHDTIEDSISEKKVTSEMLETRFGSAVARMVLDVTEADKILSWDERKRQALEHIKGFTRDSLLIKAADLVSNLSEIIDDYNKDGDQVFLRFTAPKGKKIKNDLVTITAILERWPENPFADDLRFISRRIFSMGAGALMIKDPAKIIEYFDYNENTDLECPVCNWKGKPEGNIEYYDSLFDVTCPNCDKMLLVVGYPINKGNN